MLIRRETLTPWNARERINGIMYQSNIEALWSAEELAAIGLYVPVPAVMPANHVKVGESSYEWTGTHIQEIISTAPVVITADQVKAEAQRRIMALMGAASLEACIIKQLNANMRANELNAIRHEREWTAEESAEATSLTSMAAAIKAIRAISNEIEAITPIPYDYASDLRWA